MDGMTDAAQAKAEGVELPAGYKDVAEFLDEARERFRTDVDADKDNRAAGEDDQKFLAGEGQWDPKVEAARRKKGRPVLRINDLPQYVGQVIGDTRTNRPSIKVRAVEDADDELAEIRSGLIRSIENQSNATSVYAMAGEDQVSCGIGHFRISLRYTDDDAFDQDIRIESIPNPFAVVWDAFSTEPTGADAGHAFVVDEVDAKTFKKAWPDARTTDLDAPGAGDWATKDGMRVTEYWLMQTTSRTIGLVQRAPEAEPAIIDITDDPEARALVVNGPDGRPRVREVLRREAWMYITNGTEILDGPYKLPISRIPIIKVTGREIRIGNRRYRFGLIRFAKDPMRMKNIWRSSAAEWLAMSPKQQWLAQVNDPEGADLLRRSLKSDDVVIPYTGATPPTRMDPPTAPNSLLQEAQMAQQDIKDVTGLHDASLGMKSNETSGVAIKARERQGDVATFMYHDNLNLAIKEGGKVVNELIPVAYDTARSVRVLGADEKSKIVRVNDPSAEGGHLDITKGKYDILIDTGPSYSTKRAEAADAMAASIQSMPVIGEVAADLFVEAQDWPGKEAIVKRLRKAMPPELTQDDDEEPTPEQAQAMQQQRQAQQQAQARQQQLAQAAQEMGMRKAQLELDEQEARTRQAVANADKAQAEAMKAQVELNSIGLGVSPPPGFPPTGEGSPAAF